MLGMSLVPRMGIRSSGRNVVPRTGMGPSSLLGGSGLGLCRRVYGLVLGMGGVAAMRYVGVASPEPGLGSYVEALIKSALVPVLTVSPLYCLANRHSVTQ